MSEPLVVRVPASSANLGAGFDVLAMALDLQLELGVGDAPDDARPIDAHHPASKAYVAASGASASAMWIRSPIPMGRGMGFSGAARVGGAALGVVAGSADPERDLSTALPVVVETAARLEGHGDNVAASVFGGMVAWVNGRAISLRIGPQLAAASVVVWIPDTTTSTDRSRSSLPAEVALTAAVDNLGRVAQFVLAVEHDDPSLLVGATDDRLHQTSRLAAVPVAADALAAGVEAGAWCGWLSGSGPTVAFLAAPSVADAVADALPDVGHVKQLAVAERGVHVVAAGLR